MIDSGVWDRPDAYDGTYKNMDAWGNARWATPGVLVDGEVVTTDLSRLNAGLEEFVEHSFYEKWDGQRFPKDPNGMPLSPNHPWNKDTKPKPGKQNWKERYTWDTAPTWDRMPMEAGAYTRLYMTAKAQRLPASRFLEATGHSLKIRLPGGALPDAELEWHVPTKWNAFERNRARAYAIAYSAAVSLENWLLGMEMLRQGETRVSTKFEMPTKGTQMGVGFWGTPGPYEEAVLNTPLLEDFNSAEDYKGIDILRAIRSFDPCMPCTTHILVEGSDRLITREVTTCA